MPTKKPDTQKSKNGLSKTDWKRLLHLWESDMPAATRAYAEELLLSHPIDRGILLVLADTLISLAQYEEAKSILTRVLKRKSNRWKSLASVYMGQLCKEMGQYKNAEKWYRKAMEYNPSRTTWIYVGAILARQGQYEEAKQCHRKATRSKTEAQDEAHYNLGLIYRAEGKLKFALKHLEKAIEIDPKYTKAKEARKDVIQAMKLSK